MTPLRRKVAAPPVRMAHLGLGNFFRAHQAWYTAHAADARDWGIAAFTGRRPDVAEVLRAQEGLYTVITRGGDRDSFDLVANLSRVHAAAEHDAWLACLADPEVRLLTLTVTEAGYARGPGGGLGHDRDDVRADVQALRRDIDAPVRTVPARLLGGLARRRARGGPPLTVLPCDNLPDNGSVVARVVRDLAERVDPALAEWVESAVCYGTTMVDRITPATTDGDLRTVVERSGLRDRAPVVTEPFSEWVISGTFPAGRPRWEDAGAAFSDGVAAFEQRKLRLLNGAHSLLAYAAPVRGHQTVDTAIADRRCRDWVEAWWAVAARHLDFSTHDLAGYRAALLERLANPRMSHWLAQIAADGSQKLPVRILPTLAEERAAGRTPEAATLVLAAWIRHLRAGGTPVRDVNADILVPLAAGPAHLAVPRVLRTLDPALAEDAAAAAVIERQVREFEAHTR
ncbi:MAG: mannitol dehydrogenase family protein [Carbonactinosporaceae bacterium]